MPVSIIITKITRDGNNIKVVAEFNDLSDPQMIIKRSYEFPIGTDSTILSNTIKSLLKSEAQHMLLLDSQVDKIINKLLNWTDTEI